ncbi:MAG: CopG family antitoxin [bacterium]
MNSKKKQIDPIPDEFASYEEAAEFWDTHDTTDYLEIFQTVDVQGELKKRRYEVEVDEDIIDELHKRAQKLGITVSQLVSEMLRKQILRSA